MPYRRLIVAASLALGVFLALVALVSRLSRSAASESLALCRAERADFVHEVEVRGTLESASNAEIRCRVWNQDPNKGSMILEIVPEGTYVQPGDVLVRLDRSKLEEDRKERLQYCQQGEADLVRYQGMVETAEKVLENYQYGMLVQQCQNRAMDILDAEETLRIASNRLEAGRNLYQQGFITQMQLQADQFAVDRAKVDLALEERRLDMLTKFTGPRYVKQYQRNVETYKMTLKRWEFSLELRRVRLKEVEAQIAKCTIRAPSAGQVVYANESESSYGPVVIEEGGYVRYNQTVLRLPDPKRMQVRTKIDESRVVAVRPGAEVQIALEAMPGRKFTGKVELVNDLPEPSYYWSPPVRQYEAIVRVEGQPEGLRPGWTALAKICVQRAADQLQVPVDAVFETGRRHFCVVHEDGDCKAREVKIGSTNGKTIVIREGLQPGEMVVQGAAALRSRLDLPATSPETEQEMIVATPPRPGTGRG